MSLMIYILLTEYCSGDQIEEMGAECSTYWGEKRRIQGFWCGNLRERDHFGEKGVDGGIY